jgi:hypothetical protein
MPPEGFEPTISACERLQTYALDRAVTGTDQKLLQWRGTFSHQLHCLQLRQQIEAVQEASCLPSTPNSRNFSKGGHAREDLRGEDNNSQRNVAIFNDIIAKNKDGTITTRE